MHHIKISLLTYIINVQYSTNSFSELDFADDLALLAELLELLVPALETMASEAASLGLEMNWQKTKVQALGSREEVQSLFWVRRLQWLKSLSTLAPWSTHQLKAHQISHVAMPSPVQLCRI